MTLTSYKVILTTISTFCQVVITGLAGTWIALSKLQLGKRRERRAITKETNRQISIFMKTIYTPLRYVKDTMNNKRNLTKRKNILYSHNKNIVDMKYEDLPEVLKLAIKNNLYKHILIANLSHLVIWSNNVNNIPINKTLLFKDIGNYYSQVVTMYKPKIIQLIGSKQFKLCYSIYEDVKANRREI